MQILRSIAIFALIIAFYSIMITEQLTMFIDILWKASLVIIIATTYQLYEKTHKISKIVLLILAQIIACLGIAKFIQLLYIIFIYDMIEVLHKFL